MCRLVDMEAMFWNLDDSDVRRRDEVSTASVQDVA
jgi:hypothetical protein